MTDKAAVININASLILEFASCIDEYVFANMDVYSTVSAEWRNQSKTFIHIIMSQFGEQFNK